MQPFYTIMKPGGGSHGPYAHDGEECGLILKGEMEMLLGNETYMLKKDDSFYFSSAVPMTGTTREKKTAL